MPAYSYQERFVPMVLDGSKHHTIRKRRKKGFAKKGDTLYHYFGLRTKFCKKLREEICDDVKTIIIGKKSIMLFDRRLTDEELTLTPFDKIKVPYKFLTTSKSNDLAWRDGFRPEGSNEKHTAGSFQLMHKWWKQTHELPFIGDIIYWTPTKQGLWNKKN